MGRIEQFDANHPCRSCEYADITRAKCCGCRETIYCKLSEQRVDTPRSRPSWCLQVKIGIEQMVREQSRVEVVDHAI